jgi:hypothetical protein
MRTPRASSGHRRAPASRTLVSMTPTTDPAVDAGALRSAIVETLYPISAYELADVGQGLGLPPPDAGEDPMQSKRRYVARRLHAHSLAELVDLGERVAELYGSELLGPVLAGVGRLGVDGELKQLVFAANGPKPRIVLRDALSNVIEVVENAEYCLVYDRPIGPDGLTWSALTEWWAARTATDPSEPETRRQLYLRLRESLAENSPAEHVLFEAYRSRYRPELGGRMPALLPQVYLHYDPYTLRELAASAGQVLARQRMDFLLLMRDRARVVIEVDGKQHYSDGRRSDPARYAEMVREDRKLRLAGYEVYRFGTEELMQEDGGERADAFFAELLARPGVDP